MKKALLLLLALAAPLAATPTRLKTLDNGHGLVPDDWDAALNYALAGSFKDRAYLDVNAGETMAWAFLDIKAGTLALWWNNPYEAAGLYRGLAPAGFNLAEGSISGLAPGTPGDNRILVPENRVAMGWAYDFGEALSAALCVRWAWGSQRSDHAYGDAAGGFAPSLADYVAASYPSLSYTAASNAQSSDALILSPQFAWRGGSWSLDGKASYGLNRLSNEHREALSGAAGDGEVIQSLKDKGQASYGGQLRLRWQWDEGRSLVLKGGYERLQQGLERRLKGSFSGGGFSAAQLAGYDHREQDLDLVQDAWESWLGSVSTGQRGLWVLALGLQGEASRSLARHWSPMDASVSYDAIAVDRQEDRSSELLRVPVLLGVEAGLSRWMRGRVLLQRDLWQRSARRTVQDRYSPSGALTQHSQSEGSASVDTGWTFGTGLSLDLGDWQWDLALQTAWLGAASGTALTQPLLRSTWAFAF